MSNESRSPAGDPTTAILLFLLLKKMLENSIDIFHIVFVFATLQHIRVTFPL
jgi:hypothetical protein